MKKILCMTLSLLLLASLCACGGEAAVQSTAAENAMLKAGFGRSCITPKSKLALSSSQQDTYDAVWADVYMTCIALQDSDNNTVLLFTTDISYIAANNLKTLVRIASETTGVPESNIVFSCTHNHSGLEPSGSALTLMKKTIAECSAAAMEDLSAATLSIGTAYPEGFNFVRPHSSRRWSHSGAQSSSSHTHRCHGTCR